jgi:hypothetical protein
MSCYYQLCTRNPDTKEHIPPKSFFPIDQRNQLLTVPSCEEHNNEKSSDDTYVLAQHLPRWHFSGLGSDCHFEGSPI